MPKVVLCQDGLVADLENEDGLWIVLTDPDDGTSGRFPIDPAELRAVIAGKLSFQATDGQDGSVNIDGHEGALKVRLNIRGRVTKQCRLSPEAVDEAIKSLRIGV